MVELDRILAEVRDGKLSVDAALKLLQPVKELEFAKIDLDRERRTGVAEVVYGQGKTAEQLLALFTGLMERSRRVLATRVSPEAAAHVRRAAPDAVYHEAGRLLSWARSGESPRGREEYVAIVSAGTLDQPVAEEAAATVEALGYRAIRVRDVGVAGIHRLFQSLPTVAGAVASVVVAGMEGALPGVVAGLVSRPVIAVPTSVGYGASFGGLAGLLTMLNACAPGVSVVNIDNGFGGGYIAASICRLALERSGVADE